MSTRIEVGEKVVAGAGIGFGVRGYILVRVGLVYELGIGLSFWPGWCRGIGNRLGFI